jgi:hypothetical protein
MSARRRRAWGSAKDDPQLATRISQDSKDKLDRIADALGLSLGNTLDLILQHAEVDEHGRPSWYEGRPVSDEQEELPLNRSA